MMMFVAKVLRAGVRAGAQAHPVPDLMRTELMRDLIRSESSVWCLAHALGQHASIGPEPSVRRSRCATARAWGADVRYIFGIQFLHPAAPRCTTSSVTECGRV